MKNSYIYLWRSILKTSFYKKPNTCHLAIHLLLSAAWKDHEQMIGRENVKILRGQIPTGRNRLAEETGLSPQNIRTCLQHLVNCGFLTIESTNVCSIITINKYNEYQIQQPDIQPTIQPTINQPSTNHQPLQNKGNKEIHNTPLPPKGEPYSKSFISFWGLYPKKIGKDVAYKAWKKIGSRNGVTPNQIISSLKAQIDSDHFRGTDGQQYVPNPSTWLNQGRWQDEIKHQKQQTQYKRLA